MTGKTLPPFDDLVKAQKPATLPPFSELQENKGEKAAPPAPASGAVNYPKKESKKGLNKRKKEAINIQAFASQHSKGHAMFFRHIRIPDENNNDLPGPKGGATILVDMIDEHSFTFSFAICNLEENDAYVKDEARKRCQERFRDGQIVKVTQRDELISCFENVSAAIKYYFTEDTEASEGPQLEVIGSTIEDDHLATLQRYIKKYGSSALDGESWPYQKE